MAKRRPIWFLWAPYTMKTARLSSIVFAVLRPWSTRWPLSALAGDIEYTFMDGLRQGSRDLALWQGYAARCCRAWNACLVAASVCGLAQSTPALILADALNDLGHFDGLERELRWQFGGSAELPNSADNLVPVPAMPECERVLCSPVLY